MNLPGLGSLVVVFQIASLVALLLVVGPPLYGIAVYETGIKSLPPFIPSGLMTSLSYGGAYGYYTVFDSLRFLFGSSSGGAHEAQTLIKKGTIDTIVNHPELQNESDMWNNTLQSILGSNSTFNITDEYSNYCNSFNINASLPWSVSMYIVSNDGKVLIDQCNLVYNETTGMATDFTTTFSATVKPSYGLVLTQDVLDVTNLATSTGQIDYQKLAWTIIGTLYKGNIVMWEQS